MTKKLVYCLVLLLIAASGDSFSTERCSKQKITTVCDLKRYALSRPGSRGYALFQGYVLGRAAPNEFCWLTIPDIQYINEVKETVTAATDCKQTAADAVDSVKFQYWVCL